LNPKSTFRDEGTERERERQRDSWREIKSEEAYRTNLKTKVTEIGDTKILLGCEFAAILSPCHLAVLQ
jgi:hypothetical protein